MSATAEQRREQLVALYKEVSACTKCPLHETRTKTVFGAGNADAELMFVGEAPGAEEDRQGLPFVGRAGQLLNQLLEEIGLSREEVFIANVLKSRPPGNRDPQPLEIEACEPYLFEQVRLIEPKVVCTLGNFATKLLTGSPTGITKVRGTPQVHELGGRTVFLLPLLPPGGGAAHAGGEGDAARRLRDDPGAARRAAAGAGAERRGDRRRGARGRGRATRRRPPTSSASSADGGATGSRAARRPRPKRSAPASPSASRPATSSSSRGEVGAGKTTLIRGACRALGVERPVTSPTFTIGQRYGGGRLPVSHLDLYRLADLEGEDPALLDDYLGPDGVAFVEWPAVGRRSGWAGRRWRSGSSTPAGSAARSRSTGSAECRTERASGRVLETANATCSIGATKLDPRREGPNEGTEGACRRCWWRPGCWLSAVPATGQGGGVQALRRLRDLPQRQTRARLPEAAAKRAPSSKASKPTSSTRVCVKFPSGKNLCAQAQEAEPGDALREQDHLDDPRQHTRHLVRQRQESRLLRLPGQGLGSGELALVVVGFDTATADTAACAWRDGEVLHESQLGLSPTGRPRHATALLERGRAGGRGRRRLGAGRPARGRPRARLLHRPADRHRHRARARRQPRPAGAPASAPSTRSARGIGEAGAEGERLAVLDGCRGEVFAALYSATGRADLGAAGLPARGARGAASRRWPTPPPAAGSGAVRFRHELARHGVRDRGRRRSRPPGRRAAHLRPRGGGGRRAPGRSTRSTSDLQTRSGGVSEILSREPSELTQRGAGAPARLQRPAGGDRDRAPLLPDPVVAGDVRARALEAVGHLPRGQRRRRAARLRDLLPLRPGLAPDEHRRRARSAPRAASPARLLRAALRGGAADGCPFTLEVRVSNHQRDRRCTSASASAPPASVLATTTTTARTR